MYSQEQSSSRKRHRSHIYAPVDASRLRPTEHFIKDWTVRHGHPAPEPAKVLHLRCSILTGFSNKKCHCPLARSWKRDCYLCLRSETKALRPRTPRLLLEVAAEERDRADRETGLDTIYANRTTQGQDRTSTEPQTHRSSSSTIRTYQQSHPTRAHLQSSQNYSKHHDAPWTLLTTRTPTLRAPRSCGYKFPMNQTCLGCRSPFR